MSASDPLPTWDRGATWLRMNGVGGRVLHFMLLGGPGAALVFGLGVTWLGISRPGYSAVRQTVSELGPMGERGRWSLAGLNLIVALFSIVFACGLFSVARSS